MGKEPAIRFEGYTEDWEQRKLPEIVTFYNGLTYTPDDVQQNGTLVLRSSNVKNGEVVDADNVYVNSDIVNSENVQDGDIIVVVRNGSRALIGKHAQIKGSMPNTVIGAFMSGMRSEHNEFVNALLDTSAFENEIAKNMGATINQITGYMFSKMEFMVPSGTEQEKIGEFFSNLDHLITLHQSNYEKMVVTKNSMLDKLFPQDAAKVPAIRFEGFVEDWQKKPLGAIVIPYSDPVEVPHDGYERLGIRSHGKGVFHEYVEAGKEITTAQLHRVAAHNFIVNITFAWEHAVAVTCDSDTGKLVSHRFPQFSMVDGIHDQFLKYLILDARFRHHLLLSSPGGAGRNRVLKIPEMLEYEMMIPDIQEQKQIAGYLNSLDDLIELYRIRVEKLKNIKAACLQGMFV